MLSTPVPPSKQQGGAMGATAGCATAAQASPAAQHAAPLPEEPAPGLAAAPGPCPALAAGAGRGRGRGRGGGRGRGRGRAAAASLPQGNATGQPWVPSPAAAGLRPPQGQDGASWAASAGLSGLPAGLAHALAPGSARAPGMLYACPAAWAAAGRRAAAVASAAAPAVLADLVLALLQQAAAAGGSGAREPGAAPAQRAPLPADSRLWLAEWRPPGGLPAGGGPPPKKKLKGTQPCARCLRVMRQTRAAVAPAGVAAEGRCARSRCLLAFSVLIAVPPTAPCGARAAGRTVCPPPAAPVRRARILKDGALTMIVYGADEAFKWQHRVAQFTGAVRRAPAPALPRAPEPGAHGCAWAAACSCMRDLCSLVVPACSQQRLAAGWCGAYAAERHTMTFAGCARLLRRSATLGRAQGRAGRPAARARALGGLGAGRGGRRVPHAERQRRALLQGLDDAGGSLPAAAARPPPARPRPRAGRRCGGRPGRARARAVRGDAAWGSGGGRRPGDGIGARGYGRRGRRA